MKEKRNSLVEEKEDLKKVPMPFDGLEEDKYVDMTETNAELERHKALVMDLVEGNDEINQKYKQLQEEKKKKLQEYKEMIVKMRKQKRNTNV